MKKRISILGCGWLGEPLAVHLLALGYAINGSTTSEGKLQKLKDVGINSFLINLQSITPAISNFLDSEILIITIPSKDIKGFENLIGHIEKTNIRKVIFISSTSVYSNSDEIITEQHATKQITLVEIEQLFKLSTHFNTTIIRFAGLLGYQRKPGKFFVNGKKIGNPEGFVNMIHRDDCIGIIEQIISKNISNEIFNACADTHPKRRDFYIKSALDIGFEAPSFYENETTEIKIISNQKLKRLLNFKFKYPNLLDLKDGLTNEV